MFSLWQVLLLLILPVLSVQLSKLLSSKLGNFKETQKKITPKFLVFAVLLVLLFIIFGNVTPDSPGF